MPRLRDGLSLSGPVNTQNGQGCGSSGPLTMAVRPMEPNLHMARAATRAIEFPPWWAMGQEPGLGFLHDRRGSKTADTRLDDCLAHAAQTQTIGELLATRMVQRRRPIRVGGLPCNMVAAAHEVSDFALRHRSIRDDEEDAGRVHSGWRLAPVRQVCSYASCKSRHSGEAPNKHATPCCVILNSLAWTVAPCSGRVRFIGTGYEEACGVV